MAAILPDGSGRGFTPGWDAGSFLHAQARRSEAGLYNLTVRPEAKAAPRPRAFSLSRLRLRTLEQGQAGTCWVHAAVRSAEITGAALGLDVFPICRRLAAWAGKRLEGGGNPSNGGCATDALASMSDERGRGYGVAHEALWPYTDDFRALAQAPPQAVLADAQACHLNSLVDVKDDDDARALIASGHGLATGHWWPYAWDRQGSTFIDWIGSGTFGHALCEIGYAEAGVFDDYAWFQIDNWHGELYAPLPAAEAAKVEGYRPTSPDRTADFWVRADVYARVRNYGYAERVTATDPRGFPQLFDLNTVEAVAGY